MENINLKKFETFQLENKQSRYILAGQCTGGGGSVRRDSQGRITSEMYWDADELLPSGFYEYCNLVRITHSYLN